MDYDMDSMVKFCTAALDALMRGESTFICPICNGIAHIKRVGWRLWARCDGCNEEVKG